MNKYVKHVIEDAVSYTLTFADGSSGTYNVDRSNVIELEGKEITVFSRKAGVPAHTYTVDGKRLIQIFVKCSDGFNYEIRT